MTRLLTWLDDRTGYKGMVKAALYEHIPGGARWRYVWGSTLVFTFVVQMITGFFLWTAYSPSSQTAWESVWYIQNQMSLGWLLRGIHHYTAQAMVVLLGLHMLQVIVDGAYRAPREVNFWLGLILAGLVLALGLTGYLLPWDQRGYWSTKVATNIALVVPGIGPAIQRLVVGGPEYGHHTLTRFFALHAGLLPMLMMVFIAAHVYVFRRHGLRHKEPRKRKDAPFWVDQVLRDAVACLGVLLVVLVLVFWKWRPGVPLNTLGAELSAPADPSDSYSAARPEWYFLFLFQFLKLPWFQGEAEVWGAVYVPAAVTFVLFLMPLIGKWKVGHRFNIAFTIALLTGIVLLTLMAVVEDFGAPVLTLPWLSNLGGLFAAVLLAVLLVVTLILFPLMLAIDGRRYSVGVGVAVALLMVVALGVASTLSGGTKLGRADILLLGYPVTAKVQAWAMFGLLGVVVLVLTVAVVRENVPGRDPVYSRRRELRHRFRIAVLTVLLGGTVLLVAFNVMGHAGKAEFRAAVEQAKHDSDRATVLAMHRGIPPAGALALLQDDPAFQGPRLFAQNCASCHRYDGHNGMGTRPDPVSNPQSAPDLKGFASRAWISGMFTLGQVDSLKYFGKHMAAHQGAMVEYVKDELDHDDPEERAELAKVIVALSAEAKLPDQAAMDRAEADVVAEGRKHLLARSTFDCGKCHEYGGKEASRTGKTRGPSLTGYGSRDWLVGIINNPEHATFYGKNNDRMPAYGEKGLLTKQQIEILADWIRGDYFDPSRPATASLGVAKLAAPPATRPSTAEASRPPARDVVPAAPTEPEGPGLPFAQLAAPPAAGGLPATRPVKIGGAAPTTAPAPAAGAAVDFVTHVKPLLEASCVKCHGAKKSSSGYRMHTRELAFRGGDMAEEAETPAVEPGRAKASLMYQLITTTDEESHMPPAGKAPQLTTEQIATIQRWIDAGAKWPDGITLSNAAEEK